MDGELNRILNYLKDDLNLEAHNICTSIDCATMNSMLNDDDIDIISTEIGKYLAERIKKEW